MFVTTIGVVVLAVVLYMGYRSYRLCPYCKYTSFDRCNAEHDTDDIESPGYYSCVRIREHKGKHVACHSPKSWGREGLKNKGSMRHKILTWK